ncbi:hypothetical protein CSUI_009141 [Cystoisospora suis]|uniref:Uncharacterized protein n=1 Tax=Cystoisospora suis TaxID=483139 RepID=A0A2C6K576_9APIC|nr:hypothetical protein CSUI_009141 [Cystoisospora suis]
MDQDSRDTCISFCFIAGSAERDQVCCREFDIAFTNKCKEISELPAVAPCSSVQTTQHCSSPRVCNTCMHCRTWAYGAC